MNASLLQAVIFKLVILKCISFRTCPNDVISTFPIHFAAVRWPLLMSQSSGPTDQHRQHPDSHVAGMGTNKISTIWRNLLQLKWRNSSHRQCHKSISKWHHIILGRHISHVGVKQPPAVAFPLWRHAAHLSIGGHLLDRWLQWEKDLLAWRWHNSSFAPCWCHNGSHPTSLQPFKRLTSSGRRGHWADYSQDAVAIWSPVAVCTDRHKLTRVNTFASTVFLPTHNQVHLGIVIPYN